MPQPLELAPQLRQRSARLRELALLRDQVGASESAQLDEALGDGELARLEREDLLCRGDLLAQRRFADRGGDDVAGQHQARRLELVALVVYLRAQRLQLAPRALPAKSKV